MGTRLRRGITLGPLRAFDILVDRLHKRSYNTDMMKINTEHLKWLGTAFTILGALFTSLGGLDPLNVFAFNLGAIFWLWASLRMKEAALITVNAVLLTIYVFGAILRIL